ncbi:fatty acyl-CoA reductase wat-like isoform X2 [Vespula pensylvanica]|nr:fatty acyl-CoA reductase wat-like isoform X2 [Vespula pensylvanica]
MNLLNEKLLDDITPQLIGTYPNTYVFTKSIAESVVKKHVDSIPIGIFRPAIVVPTYREPVPGWIDNLYGPVGITTSVLMGLMRIYYCDGSVKANLVPADLTVNGLIVSAWDIANNRRFIEMMLKYGKLIPFKKAIWCHSFKITKCRPIYLFYIFFLHLLPALLIDTIAVSVGKQPRLLGIYNKIHQMSNALGYFSTNEWMYINKKWNGLMRKLTSEDRKLFFCDIKDLIWSDYFPTYFLGIRKYILKDPIETLPQALIKWQR